MSLDLFDIEDGGAMESTRDRSSSPEIPMQNQGTQSRDVELASASATLVPRWCYEEGLAQRRTTHSRRLSESRPHSESEPESASDDGSVSPVRKRAMGQSDCGGMKKDMKEIKSLLQALCEKVERNEGCLKELQEAGANSSPETYTPKRKKKKFVSSAVRQEVRKIYATILEEDEENFPGWEIGEGKTIKSPCNKAVMSRLIREVKSLNPSFDAADIREAAYRFYKTRCEDDSARRRGIAEKKKLVKRRHERLIRKRKERASAIIKHPRLSEEVKKKWLLVVKNDFMSSEESDGEDVVVHPLPWRSTFVNSMFSKVDSYLKGKKSPQARRQMRPRRVGSVSKRLCPDDTPDWGITNTDSEK